VNEGRDRFQAVSRPRERPLLASEALLTTLSSCRLDITSKGGIGFSEGRRGHRVLIGAIDRADGAEVCNVKVVEELGEHLSLSSSWILTTVSVTRCPSPTSVEKRFRACSTASLVITLE